MLISGKIDASTNQCHDLLDLMTGTQKREGDKNLEKPSLFSIHLTPEIPHVINNKPPDVTGTLQKQNNSIKSTFSKRRKYNFFKGILSNCAMVDCFYGSFMATALQ